jgi:molecular chaperone GrpE
MGKPHIANVTSDPQRGWEHTVSSDYDKQNEHLGEAVEQTTGVDLEAEAVENDAEAVDRDLADLETALNRAEQEAAEQREAMLRMHAEMENLRKRLIRDLEKSRKRALEGFMNDLLPVRDSLEKGLQAAEGEASIESLREGKALIMRMLDKVMTDHGLEEIDPVGEAFNPELHEAISMIPSPQHAENTVIDVVQKGYRLNDRLVRPARVVVSSGG